MRRNPRETSWTVLYRKKHKKGTQGEEVVRRKTRRAVKSQKAIQGATLQEIMMKRNQKPEVRKAQREQAIRCVCVYLPPCFLVCLFMSQLAHCGELKEHLASCIGWYRDATHVCACTLHCLS